MEDLTQDLERRRLDYEERNAWLLSAMTVEVKKTFDGTHGPGLCIGTYRYELPDDRLQIALGAIDSALSEILDRYKANDWPDNSCVKPLVERLVWLSNITLEVGTSDIQYDQDDEDPDPKEYNVVVKDAGEPVRAKARWALAKITPLNCGCTVESSDDGCPPRKKDYWFMPASIHLP